MRCCVIYRLSFAWLDRYFDLLAFDRVVLVLEVCFIDSWSSLLESIGITFKLGSVLHTVKSWNQKENKGKVKIFHDIAKDYRIS